ncbi:uncharacterized protein METZ01_LOCUS467156, partial [marine metagenome]
MAQAISQISLDKLPPYHLEAEQSVIGACFRAEDALSKALEILSEEDFYKAAHQKIFQNMRALFEVNQPVDILGLADRMRQNNELEHVGGINYLSQLEDFVPTATAITHHAKIVREKKILRDLIYTATEIVTNSYNESDNVEDILDLAEKSIFQISEKRTRRSFFSLDEVVKENFKSIDKLVNQPGMVTGVPTGFADFDNKTSGLQP